MAYESPINLIMKDIQTKTENEITTMIQGIGIDINKEELIRALAYDRRQYEKGYRDGHDKGYEEGFDAAIRYQSIRRDK